MKRIQTALLILLLLALCCTGSLAEAVVPADADMTFEGGVRVQRNGLTIVNLHGTWHDMGRQYGALLSRELAEVALLSDEIISKSEENAAKAQMALITQRSQMPYTIRSFFKGMEETSGLSMLWLEYANSVERIGGLPRCSFVAAWDDYAAGDLVIGRNYDYGEIFQRLERDVVIAVFHPADGSMAAATIGYAGEIYAVNGMNEAGVFLGLNNGTFSSRLKAPNLRVTGTSQLFSMLFEVDTLELMDIYFNSLNNSSAYIINATDGKTVHSYEWCTIGMQRGDGADPDGIFASTNHYVSPDWEFEAPDEEKSLHTTQRRNNLIAQCEARKGEIDAKAMMEIIDTPIENGGTVNRLTVYQIVATPAARTLWLKTTRQTEWTEFDLGAFFAE